MCLCCYCCRYYSLPLLVLLLLQCDIVMMVNHRRLSLFVSPRDLFIFTCDALEGRPGSDGEGPPNRADQTGQDLSARLPRVRRGKYGEEPYPLGTATRAINQTLPCCLQSIPILEPQNLNQNAYVRHYFSHVFLATNMLLFGSVCVSCNLVLTNLSDNFSRRSGPGLGLRINVKHITAVL